MKILPLNNYQAQNQNHKNQNANFGIIHISTPSNGYFKLGVLSDEIKGAVKTIDTIGDAKLRMCISNINNETTLDQLINHITKWLCTAKPTRTFFTKYDSYFKFPAHELEDTIVNFLKSCNKILNKNWLTIPYDRARTFNVNLPNVKPLTDDFPEFLKGTNTLKAHIVRS